MERPGLIVVVVIYRADDPLHDSIALIQLTLSPLALLNMKITKEQMSDQYIKKVSSKIKIPEFQAKNISINVSDNINDANAGKEELIGNDLEKDEQKCEEIFEELKKLDKSKINPNYINPEEFEKDHDDNGHIDFIHAASNLRARNYEIVECNRLTTKMIAGKIIPTIMTTTTAVAGHV